MARQRISVIIPTLQRSPMLEDVASLCAEHHLVLEVLIINNAPESIQFSHPKITVLQQEKNIYVNPAWNLGAEYARGDVLAIVNDDVIFDAEALTTAAKILRWGFFGIVGPDLSCFSDDGSRRITHRPARHDAPTRYFGTFMCLRRRDYVHIPESLKIWGGDDWLIAVQRRPPAALIRTPFRTDMSTTTRAEEFQLMFANERSVTDELLSTVRGTRWWHRAQHWYQWCRNLLYTWSGR